MKTEALAAWDDPACTTCVAVRWSYASARSASLHFYFPYVARWIAAAEGEDTSVLDALPHNPRRWNG